MLLTALLGLTTFATISAQTITNTMWKGYFGDPINDTITLHYQKDTFFVTNTNGDLMVRSLLKVSKDTITITDIDGTYQCPQSDGVYRFTIDGDALNFTLVSDPCEGRNAITQIAWRRFTSNKK